MITKDFPYSFWSKILGIAVILAGMVMFIVRYKRNGTLDYNELAIGFSWGLLFVFFSRERTEDEMMRELKFKALTRSLIVSFFATHLYNYVFLNWSYHKKDDMILSISAYQFLALTLILATAGFYYMKHEITKNDPTSEPDEELNKG
jgi:hypothetical protein